MKRRQVLSALGASAAAATLAACGKEECPTNSTSETAAVKPATKTIKWKMVTTWPKNFTGLGEGANYLAELINQMSGGRLEVKVYGANELVPAFEVFDSVSRGTAQLGHGSAYYWKGKMPSAPFFSSMPFGLTAQEINAWMLKGGGIELWQELYKPHGVVPMPAGNTGVQMAGWFNKEINSLADLQGLRMRIPGFGGEVLKRAGGTPVLLPGGEVYTSLEKNVIDAAEWVSPHNDLAMGLYKAAKYYYYPGWHEPGTTLECMINEKALNALPEDLQHIVKNACLVANSDMLLHFTAKNNEALKTLVNEYKVDVRKLPDDVLAKLEELSHEVAQEEAAKSEFGQRVYDSLKAFKASVMAWHDISEKAFLIARG